ncbi:Nrap-domain-containing protein [Wolfiporia cocos MD-104 SS10]|uniref:Nrap-domain-containing protein n=1 Tax=Wolfiporia cocos (strain MD-104) TaxID=742152 RepID=A0A2H3JJC4_WOLCO|nr:Nrap-domain-containing protein [Wolfiporia cocos MD-104 SS10]
MVGMMFSNFPVRSRLRDKSRMLNPRISRTSLLNATDPISKCVNQAQAVRNVHRSALGRAWGGEGVRGMPPGPSRRATLPTAAMENVGPSAVGNIFAFSEAFHSSQALALCVARISVSCSMVTDLKRKRGTEPAPSNGKRRNVNAATVEEIDADGHSSDASQGSDSQDGSEPDEEPRETDQAEDGGQHESHHSKTPKGEELRDIKDATDLYRSTSFKLQIDALLPNVRPKYSRSGPLDRFLLSLHSFLNALPSVVPQHPLVASRALLQKGTAVPYSLPLPTEDTNWNVAFERPSEILLIGSWALKTNVKAKDQHKHVVDVAVAMPESLFQEKDYLNGRFFQKRAYYLAVIAAAIAGKSSGMNVEALYESESGDPRLTTLVLRHRHDSSASDFSPLNVQVRIIPVLSSSSPIPLSRLNPSRSNLRITPASTDSATDSSALAPTPLYNTALLRSMAYKTHFLAKHAAKEAVPAYADALALLRVWANQRGYGVGDRLCVRGFEGRGMLWAGILEALVYGEEPGTGGQGKAATKRKPLGKGLSSYQLFKAALDFLGMILSLGCMDPTDLPAARHDFAKERVFSKSKTGHRFPPEDYSSHESVLLDSSSMVNLLAGIPLSSLEMLKYDAQQTIRALDNFSISEDPFHSLFLKEHRDMSARFDIIARVELSSARLRKPSQHAILEHGSAYNALLASLISLLRRGLGNRTKAIAVLHLSSQPRPVAQAHSTNPSIVYIGLLLDTEHAFRLVDQGPAAAEQVSEAAQEFRDFWGEKAELRRFKDGSIVESVVWTVSNSDERAHIPTLILRHVLKRHCGISEDAVRTWQMQFDAALKLPDSIARLYRAANAQTGYKAAITAFDNLVKAMKDLDDQLPLAILNVSPISDSLRYTSPHSPVSIPGSLVSVLPSSARFVAPMEINIEFERSARWPDDLRAVQKIKLAFFESLATALMTSRPGLKASVVVGDPQATSDIQDQASLEIITAEGWAFTARIWHVREATLLERTIDDKPHIPKHLKRQSSGDTKDRQAAIDALDVYRRRFIYAPRHHRAIATLCHQCTAFAGTVRLAKRWLAAHWLLRGHISDEVVELLCASVFLQHAGARAGGVAMDGRPDVPGSKERGFALFIELLKDWDWSRGMHVPLYGSTDADGTENVAVSVTAGAKGGVWAVATELDAGGHIWTANGPDAVIARRIRALAKATWDCLQGIESDALDVQTLFTHPVEHYDFIVELDPTVLPRYAQNVHADSSVWSKGKYTNPRTEDAEAKLLPGFDPVRLLYQDLKRVYKDTFVLFHDPLGGDRYGAVWDPSLKTPRPFRVLGGFSSTPVRKDAEKSKEKDKSLVVLNEDAILSEIERIGSGLVKKIILHV